MLPKNPITHCEEIKAWLWNNHITTGESVTNCDFAGQLVYTFYNSRLTLKIMLLTYSDLIIVKCSNSPSYTADKITLNNLLLILEAFGYKNADCSLLKTVYKGRKGLQNGRQ